MIDDKEVKQVFLDMLLKLDEVCERHGLRYYLAYGTLIGALRHKGFIPWDHDIDVLMPVRDAWKLIRYQKEFGDRYFVQCKKTDPEYGSIAFKLRDSETACVWDEYKNLGFNQGLAIDIYPYYEAPKTKAGLLINIWRSHIWRALAHGNVPMEHGGLFQKLTKILQKLYPGKRGEKKMKKILHQLARVRGNEILDYYGLDITLCSAITYPKEWFGEPRKVGFEGHMLNAPTEPEKYLTRRYGDFMQLPPEDKRTNDLDVPGVIIDTKRSYREYIGR